MMTGLNHRALIAGLAVAMAGTAGAQDYEPLDNLKASELVPVALLRGPFHTVDENVAITDAQPSFMVRSRFGTWEARGSEMLVIRISELPAFEQLEKVSKTDEFVKSAGTALTAPVQVVGDLVTNPTQTAGNLFSGLGVMANRLGRTVGESAASASDSVSGNKPAAKSILKPVAPPIGAAAPRTTISDPLGYNGQRRNWAQRLNVDPYTFNGALSEKIGDMASITFAGGLPVSLTIGLVAAPLQYAQEFNAAATAQSYQIPPSDIAARNETRLKAMGIEGQPVRALFANNYFTPTLQTVLVLALDSLGNVAGRGEVVALATHAVSEIEARYVNNALLLLAQHGRMVSPLARVRSAGNVIVGQTADGRLVVPAPLDYVPWVAQIDDLARRTDLAAAARTLLVSGRVSPRARQELGARGWRVTEGLADVK